MEPATFDNGDRPERESEIDRPHREERDRYWLHILLFLLTLASTVYSGGLLAGRLLRFESLGLWWFIPDGLAFGCSLLLFLSVHEFGHYFAARHHGVNTSLPYYIPLPVLGLIGTLGAVIRIREPIPTTRKLFDIGAAGPIAGFVVAIALLFFALATLPPPTYLLDQGGHEEIKQFIQQYGRFPGSLAEVMPLQDGGTLVVGNTLLYWVASQFFANVPPMYEIYHYPVLFAAWLGLFFTALNLLPIGQLDGGHILYTLVGPRWHTMLARGFVLMLVTSGAIGFVNDAVPSLYGDSPMAMNLSWFVLAAILFAFLNRIFNGEHRLIAPALLVIMGISVLAGYVGEPLVSLGYSGWLIFGVLVVFLIRIEHPPVLYMEPLTPRRRVLGILSIIIFILCFSPRPLYLV